MEVIPLVALGISLVTLALSILGTRQKTVWQRRSEMESDIAEFRRRSKECEDERKSLREELAQEREEKYRLMRRIIK